MRVKVFRWKGIVPLLVLLVLLGIGWAVFGDRLVEDTGEEAGTEFLGAQVDIHRLWLHETQPSMALGGLEIANPFALDRNLVQTGEIALDLDRGALLEKKLVVNRFVIRDVEFGTRRATPARPVEGDGFAPSLLRSVAEWRDQFDVPVLRMSTLDTVKQLVLNPEQLATLARARALVDAADSLRSGLEERLTELDPRPVIDSAAALAERLRGANIARLGLRGVRDAAESVRRTIRSVDSVRDRVSALRQAGETGLAQLQAGAASIDDARRQDYDFARSLLELPRFDAPNLGRALFGDVSIDRLQQVVYWSELAQRYLPPGLRPNRVDGPRRLRMDGTSVLFPKARDYPAFLLRDGRMNLAFELGGSRHTIEGVVQGITTRPALYGGPAIVRASGTIGGANPLRVGIDAVLDHTGPTMMDSIVARLDGFRLPEIGVPGLPFRVDPGAGRTSLSFTRAGDRIRARWSLQTDAARWVREAAGRDTTAVDVQNVIETVVWRVLSGLSTLEVTAELEGAITKPNLRVRSNIDEAIAARLTSLFEEELARAESRVRAEVDRHIEQPIREARSRVAAYEAQVLARLGEVERELQEARDALEARLKNLVLGL